MRLRRLSCQKKGSRHDYWDSTYGEFYKLEIVQAMRFGEGKGDLEATLAGRYFRNHRSITTLQQLSHLLG